MTVVNPPSPESNPFQHLKVRYLILQFILLSFLVGFVLNFIAPVLNINQNEVLWETITAMLVMIGFTFWVWQQSKGLGVHLPSLTGKVFNNYRFLPTLTIIIFLFLFSLGAFQFFYGLISFVAPDFVENFLNQKIFVGPSESSFPLLKNILIAINIVIVAPITEEFIFRGIILHRWAEKWNIQIAVVASSLFFGVLHGNAVGLFIFGLAMALLYLKTNRLIVPIIAHTLNNFAVLVIEFILLSTSEVDVSYSLSEFRSQWWVGLLYIAISAPFIWQFIQNNWPRKDRILPYGMNQQSR